MLRTTATKSQLECQLASMHPLPVFASALFLCQSFSWLPSQEHSQPLLGWHCPLLTDFCSSKLLKWLLLLIPSSDTTGVLFNGGFSLLTGHLGVTAVVAALGQQEAER